MTTTTIDQYTIHVDQEGFLADPSEWTEDLAAALAAQIGISLSDQHRAAIRFAREDFAQHGEAPTVRRLAVAGGIPTKTLFTLFPQKPAKKLAYVSGLPKPRGCV